MAAAEELEQMTDEEFRTFAFDLLSRELGLYGYARFLRVCVPGKGDYTAERHQWLDGITLEELERDMAALASPTTPPR